MTKHTPDVILRYTALSPCASHRHSAQAALAAQLQNPRQRQPQGNDSTERNKASAFAKRLMSVWLFNRLLTLYPWILRHRSPRKGRSAQNDDEGTENNPTQNDEGAGEAGNDKVMRRAMARGIGNASDQDFSTPTFRGRSK